MACPSPPDLRIEPGQVVGPAVPGMCATITPLDPESSPFGTAWGSVRLVCDVASHDASFGVIDWKPGHILVRYPSPSACPPSGHGPAWTYHVEVFLADQDEPSHCTGTVYAIGPEGSRYPGPPWHAIYELAGA